MSNVRVRFAPSPTGPLHIGGVRTALYNYLFAKSKGGTFILRIEDTDRTRYVEGAEEYIIRALNWCGLYFDEGPVEGGEHGPYRQSDRQDIYLRHTQMLLENGTAYYAFDTPEELDAMRERLKAEGVHSPKYDATTRMQMRNSLTMSAEELDATLSQNTPYVVRLLVEAGNQVTFQDEIRGEVTFETNELDDKVLLKADGMPTYHMANVIDDRNMEISHVIRGEEWLSSTAHHVLLYRAFGWEEYLPVFAHLPLILKPTGKGKLSKRDGAKFGFPVFPLSWPSEDPDQHVDGFDAFGFDPKAVVNFISMLGWNPGSEQEMFSLDELINAFSLDHIHKGGARFDYDKAKWFNQQYIQATPGEKLAEIIKPQLEAKGYDLTNIDLPTYCDLLKPRVTSYLDFVTQGYYFFEDVYDYDEKLIRKKWSEDKGRYLKEISAGLGAIENFEAPVVSEHVKKYLEVNELGFGQVFPFLRIALSGTTKGPDLFEMMTLLGKKTTCERIDGSIELFNRLKSNEGA